MIVPRETPPPESPPEQLIEIAGYLASRAYPLGLTNYASPEDLLREAILPCLAICDVWDTLSPGSCAELGPGSGAMGLSLAALHPEVPFTLVDRRERVVSFLDVAARVLGMTNVTALAADVGRAPLPCRYDLVVLRAFAKPAVALGAASAVSAGWIAVWHSPETGGYDSAPAGFGLEDRLLTSTDSLVCTLYHRNPA